MISKSVKIIFVVVLGLMCIGLLNPPKAQLTQPRAAHQPIRPAGCSVDIALCKSMERLNADFEVNRPCYEMSKRGMQAEADRCFKETREFERDIRDRIRFQEGR